METKYRHEDIVHVQTVLWPLYKGFLDDKDENLYKARADALVSECEGQIKVFCYNLVSAWLPVIDGLAADFRNGRNTELREAEIKHIQNTVWVMYKEFQDSHSVKEWTQQAEFLVHKYDSREIRSFCECLLISWAPVINGLKQEFKNRQVM